MTSASVVTRQSAPHPRGCSYTRRAVRLLEQVGPAPAGMLRPAGRGGSQATSRPRTRGDAPLTARGPAPETGSAPHPRGCSQGTTGPAARAGVGPAPAGMLRRTRSAPAARRGRPRTRGDASHDGSHLTVDGMSAQHPRGCPYGSGTAAGAPAVGPARAGMLLPSSWRRRGRTRRPRTRGDAPRSADLISTRSRSAPHARGCSLPRSLTAVTQRVGPARAGMFRRPARCRRGPRCRPRTRGDAPQGRRASRMPFEVGPAPAGMLPHWALPQIDARSRPRTRGDAPPARWPWPPGWLSAPHPRGCSPEAGHPARTPAVGPAPAGMLLPSGPVSYSSPCRPRTRGDAPGRRHRAAATQPSAPHPRGCSARPARAGGRSLVGPAPAGMLLAPGVPSPSPQSRPRTRGDAPSIQLVEEGRVPSAPHPRGCSPVHRHGAPLRLVGPAPAGMLPSWRRACPGRAGRPRTRGDAPTRAAP